jgi:hypothetical protein
MRTLVLATLVLALSTACSAEPAKDPAPRSTPSKPATPPPRVEVESASPSADAFEPVQPGAAPSNEWWCLCYSSETKDSVQPTTSCRQREAECRALARRVVKGGRGLVADSITHGCRKLEGEHPGDATGGRDPWKPSKVAGAWTSEGACLLAGEPELADGGSETEDQAFSLLSNEALGDLRLGMAASEVIELLGQPKKKSGIDEEAATGDFVQSWDYPDLGLQLGMAASSRRGSQSLNSIIARPPCSLQTRRGIGIGSSFELTDQAYGALRDLDVSEPNDRNHLVAGSIYGGVIFSFEDGVVSEIFFGAAAE